MTVAKSSDSESHMINCFMRNKKKKEKTYNHGFCHIKGVLSNWQLSRDCSPLIRIQKVVNRALRKAAEQYVAGLFSKLSPMDRKADITQTNHKAQPFLRITTLTFGITPQFG